MKFIIMKKECQTKDGKRKFVKYLTKMKSSVDSSEEKFVNVKFNDELKAKTKNITYGIIECKDSDVNLPRSIEPYEKNGKTVYPYVWVNNFEKFTEKERPQTTQPVFSVIDEPVESIEKDENLPF